MSQNSGQRLQTRLLKQTTTAVPPREALVPVTNNARGKGSDKSVRLILWFGLAFLHPLISWKISSHFFERERTRS